MTTPAAENPLVPHAVLRGMYASMLEARLLEEHLRAVRRLRPRDSIRGEEACRAATVQCLKAGDLVSDGSLSGAADRMLGVSLRDVLSRDGVRRRGAAGAPLAPNRLPREGDARRQLDMALGAGQALKVLRGQQVVFVFYGGARHGRLWREVLGRAGEQELPVIFLLTAAERDGAERGGMAPGLLSDRARGWGVPGIPVDGSDGVALYRVLSEAVLRARAGDGPTLVEGVTWWLPDDQRRRPTDPLIAMALALLARKAATTRWQEKLVEGVRAKLRARGRAGRDK